MINIGLLPKRNKSFGFVFLFGMLSRTVSLYTFHKVHPCILLQSLLLKIVVEVIPLCFFGLMLLSLQFFLGAAQCLGELYRHFGRRITSGLVETTVIVSKLVKFHEVLWFNCTIL